MDFTLPQKLQEFQSEVREFVSKKVIGQIERYDELGCFPTEIFRALGKEGFLGASVPPEHGGLGLGTLGYCILSEELARASAGLTHNGHFQTQRMILCRGTEGQKAKYLAKLTSGEYLGAMAISEPTVGSSFQKMQTRAHGRDGYYLLNGVKTNINDAAEADLISVFAVAEEGLTIFLLEKNNPGFRTLRKLEPMGMRSSPFYEFELKDCQLPPEQILGKLGGALEIFFETFNYSRLGNASALLGIAKIAFERALAYATQREVGPRRVSDFQGIRWMLAEMKTHLEAASLLRDKAALMVDRGLDPALESSMAKLFCAQVAMEATVQAIEILASYGCYRESQLPRLLLDAKTLCIAGGTLEVMKNNIASQLVGRGGEH